MPRILKVTLKLLNNPPSKMSTLWSFVGLYKRKEALERASYSFEGALLL